jgi:dethiobiotin synthetase
LGCLNHALLTHDAMVRSGVACAGWVANCVLAELPRLEENLDTLKSRLSFPCLGVIPYGAVWDESVPKYFKRADFFNCRMLRNLA